MESNRAPAVPLLPMLGSVIDFLRVVWGLDHELQRTSKHMEAALGITAPQRLVIRILGRFPGTTAGQLAAILHVHPSTLTGILRRLQSRGLITKRTDPRDRRRLVLGLTARGRTLDADSEGTVEAAVRAALADLPDRKVLVAVQVLERLTSELERRNRVPGA